ncbi:MAG: PilN domain-containing protein [Thermoanaerobaculia bacterium]
MARLARLLLVVLAALIPLTSAWAGPATAPKSATLQTEVARLRFYQARQKFGLQLLDGISRSLPELLWLDRLNFSNERVVIDGRALNTNALANFIENLDKLPALEEPMLRSTTQEPGPTYKFTITTRPRRPPTRNTSLEEERDFLRLGIALQSELPEVLQRLRALLDHPAVKVEKFKPLPLSGKGRGELVKPVEIRIRADSFHAAVLLFDRLDRFPPVVALDRMTSFPDRVETGVLHIDFRLVVPVLNKRPAGPREARESEAAGLEKTDDPGRQPFQAQTPDEATRSRRLRPDGVPGLLIDDLELHGIFRTSKGYVAQVSDQRGKKSYLLKEGDRLFDGEVVRITKDEAVFRQQTSGATGEPREVVKSLKTP